MRIYVFTEHFPNPYKPYLDTQFCDFLAQGHELRIFAFGRFDGVLPKRTVQLRLRQRTTYLPLTLRSLPRVLGARTLRFVWSDDASAKRNVLDAARAALLPSRAPDLCLIHNLVTAQYLPFLARIWPHARIALYFHGGEPPGAGSISEEETRRVFGRVHRVFTNTAFSRAQAIARGCPPEKICVCPVGFWLDDYEARFPRPYRQDGVLRLLCAGRVSREKGLEVAIAALRRLRHRVALRIVGRGPALAGLQAQGGADFAGQLSSEALIAEYAKADAFLLPSLRTPQWEETQACVVQEAMLMRLPVIATRTGGVLESLAPPLHPLSVEPGDAAMLAERLEELAGWPDERFAELGEAARAFALARYDVRVLDAHLLSESFATRLAA